MTEATSFWFDLRKAAAQWAGIALSAVFGGILLGLLIHRGMAERRALEIAVSIASVLALGICISIARSFSMRHAVPLSNQISSAVLTIEGNATPLPTVVFSVAFSYSHVNQDSEQPVA